MYIQICWFYIALDWNSRCLVLTAIWPVSNGRWPFKPVSNVLLYKFAKVTIYLGFAFKGTIFDIFNIIIDYQVDHQIWSSTIWVGGHLRLLQHNAARLGSTNQDSSYWTLVSEKSSRLYLWCGMLRVKKIFPTFWYPD